MNGQDKGRRRPDRRRSVHEDVSTPVIQPRKKYASMPKSMNFQEMVNKHTGNMKLDKKRHDESQKSSLPHSKNVSIREGWIIGDKNGDINLKYKLEKKIGSSGSYGYCVIATEILSGAKRAIKVISKEDFTESDIISLRTEIKVMKHLEHPNLIRMYDAFETESTLYIVMELCTGGELYDLMKQIGTFKEKDAARILKQVAMGLKYMHDKNVAHCDVKPDNFMFLNTDKDSCVKIIDFGMSKIARDREHLTERTGTAYYVAPEVLKGKYSKHCDIWSLGVVMFAMLFGYPPFSAENIDGLEIVRQHAVGFQNEVRPGKGPWFPENIPVSESAKDLITQALTIDTAQRITADEILKHPFITGYNPSIKPKVGNAIKDLQTFQKLSETKQMIVKLVANTTLTERELQDLRTRFAAIDIKGQGSVNMQEMTNVMRESLVSSRGKREITKLAAYEKENSQSKSLQYKEFVFSATYKKLIAKEDRIASLFRQLDTDSDGDISIKDLKTSMGISAERAQRMYREIGYGQHISFDIFAKYWASKKTMSRRSSFARPESKSVGSATKERKKKSSLGAKLAEDSEGFVYVEQISQDRPAAIGGLKVNDIIRKVNDRYISDMKDFVNICKNEIKPKATVTMEIKRGMQVKTLTIVLD